MPGTWGRMPKALDMGGFPSALPGAPGLVHAASVGEDEAPSGLSIILE